MDHTGRLFNEVLSQLDLNALSEEEKQNLSECKYPEDKIFFEVPCPSCGEMNAVDIALAADDWSFQCHNCDTCIDDVDLATVSISVKNPKVV